MATTPFGRSPSETSPETPPPITAPTSEALDSHLSYPAPSEAPAPVASSSSSVQARPLLRDRLYIGNLHSTVDEYTLLQIFSKFGKISKFDYLFHKSGPLKGKPRGYAFVEYATKHEAETALAHAHNKLLRGRKLVVTYANQAPLESTFSAGGKNRRPMSEVGKPTTLSLLKNAGTGRTDATDAKIARMEAKLRQLEDVVATPNTAASDSSSLPAHPSLPPKPVAAIAAAASAGPLHAPTSRTSGGAPERGARTRAPPLPSLPIAPSPQSHNRPRQAPTPVASPPAQARAPSAKKIALSGVRIVKPKNTASAG